MSGEATVEMFGRAIEALVTRAGCFRTAKGEATTINPGASRGGAEGRRVQTGGTTAGCHSTRLRVLATVLVSAVVASSASIVLSTSPAAAAENAIDFGGGATGTTVGANAVVRIDGRLVYDDDCPDEGFDDFVYPATDVYVIKAGSVAAGAKLSDAAGGQPNTIVATTSLFIGEIIAVTTPGGQLGEGVYDVVYDTCQDGAYDPPLDTLFPSAISVKLPAVLPDPSPAIGELKNEARAEFVSWLATYGTMKGIFMLAAKAMEVQCATSPLACALEEFNFLGHIEEKFMNLLLSQANHYLAIAQDPPDPDFKQLTVLPPMVVEGDNTDSPITNSATDAVRPLVAEAALNEAFLHAVERYQGAQSAGDGEWALIHARQARDLAATLRAQLPATTGALARISNELAADGADVDAGLVAARDFWLRMYRSGFTSDERRTLRNQGLSVPEINGMESEVVRLNVPPGLTVTKIKEELDAVVAAHAETGNALASTASGWDAIVAELEALPSVPEVAPVASAGGPYTVAEGATLTLDGAGSSTPGGTTITYHAWDLDGDSEFDDADGPRPAVSFPTAGSRVIGLRVRNSENREAVAFAAVEVTELNIAPVVSSPLPDERTTTVVVGSPTTFSVTADDRDGDPLSYTWTVDGALAGVHGPSLTYDPPSNAVGRHAVETVISDGTVAGGATRRSWEVIVILPDADGDGWTATTDCNESDPMVAPGANELVGNGVDDDCDPATADAPPGGLTGSMWGWGMTTGVGNGQASPSNTITAAPEEVIDYDDAVQVESETGIGYGVRASGEVLAWGSNFHGQLGDGTTTTRLTPVSPVAVGGGAGRLSGVTRLSASDAGSVLARRSDGTVVAWGENRARQLGDGSTVTHRTYPVPVLAGPDGTPLSDVRAVETGQVTSYALIEDGTVRAWGSVRCDGRTNPSQIRLEPFPVTLPLVGGDVRQISAWDGGALFLKKDGTVLSCALAGTAGLLGRPVDVDHPTNSPHPVSGFGPGSGVIAVSAGHESALALKADGTVWAWGYNANGSLSPLGVPLGTGGASFVETPRQVPLPPGPPVIAIENDRAWHTLVVRADGSVLVWGGNSPMSQTGTGQPPSDAVIETPTVVNLPGHHTIDIATGGWNSVVLTRPTYDSVWERPATWVHASVDDATLDEGSAASFRLSTSFALPHDVTVSWSLAAGTAGKHDIVLAGGTATVPAGSTSADVVVTAIDDTIDEDDETFSVILTDASHGLRLSRPQGRGTIIDDDAPPSVSVQPARVTEGHTSLTDAHVRVVLSAPSAKPITVTYATSDGTAVAPGDYRPTIGTLTIAPTETTGTVHIPIHGDTAVEAEEWLTVALSAAENASVGTSSARVTIADDEALVLNVASPTVTEGTGGTTTAAFRVSLDPPAPEDVHVSVSYGIETLTAIVPDDVAAASGTLSFGPGDGPKEVTVAVQADNLSEPRELFRLVLGTPQVGGDRLILLGDNAPAVIVDDDPTNRPPSCSSLVADPSSLWPPDHKLRTVTVRGATDPDGDAVTLTITEVTQDEPVNGLGDGDASPDAHLGPTSDQAQLRAERSGTGDGRIYRLAVTAEDPEAANCTAVVTVGVPHNRHATPVDSRHHINSLAP